MSHSNSPPTSDLRECLTLFDVKETKRREWLRTRRLHPAFQQWQAAEKAWEKRVKDIGEKHGFDLRIEQAPEEPSNGRESEDAATIRTDPHQ